MADRLTVLLVLGYLAGLGLLVLLLQHDPSAMPAPTPAPTQPIEPVELPPIAVQSIAIYDAVIERPLFNKERRPAAEAQGSTQTVDDRPLEELDGFRLAAVLKGLGSITALVEDQSGATRTLRPGERLGKWKLEEILDDRVTLSADGRRETLHVYRFEPVQNRNQQTARTTRKTPRRIRPRPERAPTDEDEDQVPQRSSNTP